MCLLVGKIPRASRVPGCMDSSGSAPSSSLIGVGNMFRVPPQKNIPSDLQHV